MGRVAPGARGRIFLRCAGMPRDAFRPSRTVAVRGPHAHGSDSDRCGRVGCGDRGAVGVVPTDGCAVPRTASRGTGNAGGRVTALVIRSDAAHLPLPDNSVDLIVTSPPYFALRSYQDGGQHYAKQI